MRANGITALVIGDENLTLEFPGELRGHENSTIFILRIPLVTPRTDLPSLPDAPPRARPGDVLTEIRLNGEVIARPNLVLESAMIREVEACLGQAICPDNTPFRRGDANSDGDVNLTDAVNVLDFLFRSGAAPLCAEAADSDNSGTLEITDPIRVIVYLFLGGPAPEPPGPMVCGVDPDGGVGSLGCDEYTTCD